MPAMPHTALSTAAFASGSQRLALDLQGSETLKARAAADPAGTTREAARQFESLFMQELLKTMRQSTMPQGLMDNDGSRLGQEMLDGQLAQKMSGLPGGLSDVIARQLDRQMGLNPGPIPRVDSANAAPVNPVKPQAAVNVPQTAAATFISQHTKAAQVAEKQTGIPAAFMIAQSALETGWGRKEIRHADGTPAYNLFGIKAGANWKGPTAEVTTTEYVNGKPQKMVQRFRAYGSYAESFADYAKLMRDNPRYEGVVAAGSNPHGFARGLQRAGYATDPAYADKLSRVINTTLRLQRTMA
jgi:peptidoglycan hydrolase FlgJ